MKRVLVVFVVMMLSFGLANSQQEVTLETVTNTYQDTNLLAGNTHVFSLRVTNNSPNYYNTANGFRVFSNDGATWNTLTGAWLNDFDDFWSKTYINPFDVDGAGSDSIGFAGVSFGFPDGLPPGYDDLAYKITIGPTVLSDVGKHICIDSSWYRPGGTWKWSDLDTQNPDVYPDWSGQKCFRIMDPVSAESQQITLSGVTNTYQDTNLLAGNTHVFSLRVTNNTDNLYNTTNGFRIFSDDGATWTTTTGAWLNNFDDFFSKVYINPFDVDGAGSDTIGFAGVSFGPPDGLPPSYDDLAYKITIGPTVLSDVGRHICIDSSWYRPGGTWKWADIDLNPDVYPDWSGQKCYRIMDPVSAESQQITLAGVTNTYQDTSLLAGNTHVFSLRVTNNSANLYNTSNGFRIFSDDGATWTTITGAWLNNFDDLFTNAYINPFDVDGAGSDTIGFAGVSFGLPDGLPPGYDDLAFQITIGPSALADVGKHICIDSSWYRPGGTWKWADLDTQNPDVYPDWSGQKCFRIMDPDGVGSQVTLAGVTNTYQDTCLLAGNTHVFSLRVTNNSANLYNTTNGFRIFSDDGATWTTMTGAWLNNFDDLFTKAYINPFNVDGAGSDTIGFAGVSFAPPEGLPAGYNDLAFQITIGPTVLSDVGRHICIDSSWYRPGGTWKWAALDTQNQIVYPDWSGQKCYRIIDLVSDASDEAGSGLPNSFALAQNYPNPFNPTCIIKFDVPHRAKLTLKVFNILGQQVATLVNGDVGAGFHQVEWDASGFGSGVYFYRLEADDGFLSTKKMMVLK